MSKKAILIGLTLLLILTTVLFSGCGAKYTLLIKYEGKGVVLPNPEGPYKKGTVVQLTATAADGYVFSHWSGKDGASVKDNKIIMDDNKSIVAVFVKLIYDLTVNVFPENSGTVEVELMGYKDVHQIEAGQTVKLTPKPILGYKFAYWDDDPGNTANPRTMVVDSNKTITAHFVPVLKGRVIGQRTGNPIAGVTINFSDGGEVISDANGCWAKTYDPAAPPSGPITIAALPIGYEWESIGPSPVTVNWPAEEIIFTYKARQYLATWTDFDSGTGTDTFSFPEDVAVDPFGNVIVADTYNNRILKFSRDGNLLFKLGADGGASGSADGHFDKPRGVATDADGDIYVADTRNYRIQKFSPDGEFIGSWGTRGTGNGQFWDGPYDVVVDSHWYVYATDPAFHRIQKFTNYGLFVTAWGSLGTGGGQFNFPRCLAVDAEDNIYVTDCNNDNIQKFSSDGDFLARWGSTGTGAVQFDFPCGVTVDVEGNIYVGDSINDRIHVLNKYGNYVISWGTMDGGTIPLDGATGVALDSDGYFYVVCRSTPFRIVQFRLVD